MKRFPCHLLIAVALVAACRRPQQSHPVVVLTTQRVTTMGITHSLAEGFHGQTAVPVQVRIVSADDILHAAETRSGAVVVYRNPGLDEELQKRNALRLRNVFAYEDYVIVGPRRDPAHVSTAKSAADAFERIVKRRRVFCSPVDLPVLLDVEHEIWSAADEKPQSGSRYRSCHGNATDVLTHAAGLDAYTVTDRATAEAKLPKQSRVLMRNVPILHSEYVVAQLETANDSSSKSAEWFVEWVMSTRGREFVNELHSSTVPKLYLPGGR